MSVCELCPDCEADPEDSSIVYHAAWCPIELDLLWEQPMCSFGYRGCDCDGVAP